MKKFIIMLMVLCTLGSAFAVDIDWENSGYVRVPETDRFDRPTGKVNIARIGEHTFSNSAVTNKTGEYIMAINKAGAGFIMLTYGTPIFEFDGAEYTMYALRRNGNKVYEVPMTYYGNGLIILKSDWYLFVNGVNEEITSTPGDNFYRIIIEENDGIDSYDLGFLDLTWQKSVQDFVNAQN